MDKKITIFSYVGFPMIWKVWKLRLRVLIKDSPQHRFNMKKILEKQFGYPSITKPNSNTHLTVRTKRGSFSILPAMVNVDLGLHISTANTASISFVQPVISNLPDSSSEQTFICGLNFSESIYRNEISGDFQNSNRLPLHLIQFAEKTKSSAFCKIQAFRHKNNI